MGKINLEFVCSEFTLTDLLPSNKEFHKISDVNNYIWEKYGEQIEVYVNNNVNNVISRKDRLPLKFDYVNSQGIYESISFSQDISEVNEKTDIVNWHPEVVGGMTPIQIFGNHATDTIKNPNFRHWKLIVDGKPGFGIQVIAVDKDEIIRTIKVLSSIDYPNSPPKVLTEPKFTNDICFDEKGELHYTNFIGTGSPWLNCVNRYKNPLLSLLDELIHKYKFSI